MAKRFIDTDIFKKSFTRGLDAPYKLLWIYITTDCNHAGVWECDFETACIKIGVKVNKESAIKKFGDKITVIDSGEKWFIPSFIEFQYGELRSNNKAHNNVILILSKYGLIDEDLKIKAPSKPLQSPFKGAKETEEEKEKEKEEEEEKGATSKVVFPFETESFFLAWSNWLMYRKEKKISYKGIVSEQAALNALSKFSEEFAIKLINTSMANSWQGLIFDKTHQEYEQFRKTGTKAEFGKEIDDLIGSGTRGY